MDLCIKTHDYLAKKLQIVKVSILVLMDLCIKTLDDAEKWIETKKVSILVLMDLCIKTGFGFALIKTPIGFNPCFNGSMYKNTNSRNQCKKSMVFQSLF